MLNKLVTSPFIGVQPYCGSGFDEYDDIEPFENLIYFAIKNSAYEILIPYSDIEALDVKLSVFSPLLRKRIKIIDRNKKIFNKTKELVTEFRNSLPDRFAIPATTGNTYSNFWDYSTLIFDFTYKLLLASKHEAEADVIFLENVEKAINEISNATCDKECKFLLSELGGILNLYGKETNISSIQLKQNISPQSTTDRISELFDDLEMCKLSEERHMLGFHKDFKKFYLETKSLVRGLIRSPKYNSLIKGSKKLIKISKDVQFIPDALSVFSEIQNDKYSPPLVCLDKYRYDILTKEYDDEMIFPMTPVELSGYYNHKLYFD